MWSCYFPDPWKAADAVISMQSKVLLCGHFYTRCWTNLASKDKSAFTFFSLLIKSIEMSVNSNRLPSTPAKENLCIFVNAELRAFKFNSVSRLDGEECHYLSLYKFHFIGMLSNKKINLRVLLWDLFCSWSLDITMTSLMPITFLHVEKISTLISKPPPCHIL